MSIEQKRLARIIVVGAIVGGIAAFVSTYVEKGAKKAVGA